MDFKRVISILVLAICIALAVHASPAKCMVGLDLVSIDIDSGKFSISNDTAIVKPAAPCYN